MPQQESCSFDENEVVGSIIILDSVRLNLCADHLEKALQAVGANVFVDIMKAEKDANE